MFPFAAEYFWANSNRVGHWTSSLFFIAYLEILLPSIISHKQEPLISSLMTLSSSWSVLAVFCNFFCSSDQFGEKARNFLLLAVILFSLFPSLIYWALSKQIFSSFWGHINFAARWHIPGTQFASESWLNKVKSNCLF